jgi:hypothetical protein
LVANLTATVKLVDQSAPSAATTTSFLVEPFGQRAVLASGDLAPGASGFAEVCTTNGGSFRAESVFYYYGLDGSVASVVQEDSRLGRCDMSFSSYNTFLSQDNWLRVTNPGEDPIVIEIETFDLTGALIGASSQNIAPSQGLDLNLVSEFSLASDNYGQIKVNVLTSNGGFVVGDVLRVNFGPDGTVVHAEVYPLD